MIMLKDRRMTVVGRLEGLIQPEDFINQLTFIMDANQTYLMSERLERSVSYHLTQLNWKSVKFVFELKN